MKEEVGEVKPERVKIAEPVIEGQGKHGQGVVISHEIRGKNPTDRGKGEGLEEGIFLDVPAIIPIGKRTFQSRKINHEGCRDEQKNPGVLVFVGYFLPWWFSLHAALKEMIKEKGW